MNFDFKTEMVFGKKHIDILKFNKSEYDFISPIQTMFNTNKLDELHLASKNDYKLFKQFGEDSSTEFHKLFYETINNEESNNVSQQLKENYIKFIKNVIFPYLNLEQALVQKFPTIRFHLPNNVAVARPHIDSEFHPIGEINFTIAITDMYDTNSIWIETMPRLEEYICFNLKEGDCICFNANLCSHYNKINETGKTRVSMDFRVLPLNMYDTSNNKKSASTNQNYVDGGYYNLIKL
jgi:hypothetical protein